MMQANPSAIQKEKLKELAKISALCLAHRAILPEKMAHFGRCLKKSSEELRALEDSCGKQGEQAFCHNVIQEIIRQTQSETSKILANNTISQEERVKQIANLAYLSQSMIALTRIQQRFGGRLGYHCLIHTLGVAQYPDFLTMCAGANHDAVMKYAEPPDFFQGNLINIRANYHQKRSLLADVKNSVDTTSRQMYLEKKQEIQELKFLTEQKKLAGWEEGDSEKESFNQMEAQLEQLIEAMGKGVIGKHKEFDLINEAMLRDRPYRAALIKGTIPTRNDFDPVGRADKLNTISNTNVFPGIFDLAMLEGKLRNRIISVIDNAITKILGVQAYTFQQAWEDSQFRQSTSLNDPMKPLKDIPNEIVIKQLKESLFEDILKYQDMLLINYIINQIKIGIIGNLDLGALMKQGAETEWLRNEIIGLIVEENPYQAESFFAINRKLQDEGGLSNEEVHLKLRESSWRADHGIKDDDYLRMLEFQDIAFYFINENLPFSKGAILRFQLYIYEPMKAVQKLLKEPIVKRKCSATDQIVLENVIFEFERLFCVDGNLRSEILAKIESYIESCQTAGSLSKQILKAMQNQFGDHFLKKPYEYGYTIGDKIRTDYLREQDIYEL